jgi:tungstate transport system permease protein
MDRLAEAFSIALRLIATADPVVLEITARTLAISASATLAGALLFMPGACLLHFSSFRGKGAVLSIVQALYGIPTVSVGLLVFLILSRTGPLGTLSLLFTPGAIVIAEVLLIAPVLVGQVVASLRGVPPDALDTIRSLGAGRVRAALAVLLEARFAVLSAVFLSFGRAISEVGAAMMVGGNIAGRTRTLTTAISLEVGKGETALSIALGIILLTLALLVSAAVHWAGQRKS